MARVNSLNQSGHHLQPRIQNFLNTSLKGADTHIVIKAPKIPNLPKLIRIRVRFFVKKICKEIQLELRTLLICNFCLF